MNDFVISDLNDEMRKKVKRYINNLKTNQEEKGKELILEHQLKSFQNKLYENKEKRKLLFDDNKIKDMTNLELDMVMQWYEYEGYELELEIAMIEKELVAKKMYQKRLRFLHLILNFPQGAEVMSVKLPSGIVKKVHLKDIYSYFLTMLLDEVKENFKMKQRIMQLLLYFNNLKHCPVAPEHKFYLDEVQHKSIYAETLEIRKAILEVEKDYLRIPDVDYDTLKVADFINLDSEFVYNSIFGGREAKREINKKSPVVKN